MFTGREYIQQIHRFVVINAGRLSIERGNEYFVDYSGYSEELRTWFFPSKVS